MLPQPANGTAVCEITSITSVGGGGLTQVNLTLTDDTDLANFRRGDAVYNSVSYDIGGGTVTADKTPSGQFGSSTDPNILLDGTTDTFLHFEISGDSGLPVKFSITPTNPIPGGSTLTLFYSFGNNQLTFDNQWKPVINSVNGIDTPGFVLGEVYLSDEYEGKSAVKIPFASGAEVTTFEFTLPDTSGNAATVYGFLADGFGKATVLEIKTETNAMVVSGGTWTVDDPVYGPATTPATGTFGSASGSTMTRQPAMSQAASAGSLMRARRWLVLQDLLHKSLDTLNGKTIK